MNHEISGLYIHIPFCRRKCPYCNFYFKVARPQIDHEKILIEDFNGIKSDFPYIPFNTMYFGGGTPSLLSYNSINNLVGYFKNNDLLKKNAEITLEVNPEDISDDFLGKILGSINRLSFGVQSLDDTVLKFLGRKHDRKMALNSIKTAIDLGFNNISIDFILGVFNQDIENILNDIDLLYCMGVCHFSTYLLTIEENTFFYKKMKQNALPLMKDEEQVFLYNKVQKKLTDLGFIQYDISNFAIKGFESKHNQLYWGKGSYLGLGKGAHSCVLNHDGSIVRFAFEDHFFKEILDPKTALKESLAFGLRNLKEGINIRYLTTRHKTQLSEDTRKSIEKMIDNGSLLYENNNYIINPKNVLFADAIMREFF